MIQQPLHVGWSVRVLDPSDEVPPPCRDADFPAVVPGTIHRALMDGGAIPHPYEADNENAVQWIGRSDWRWTCRFEPNASLFEHERLDLACDGLDTLATLTLNGKPLGETRNQFRRYRFDVREHLVKGENELTIDFASAVKYAESEFERLGERRRTNGPAGPFNFIRKMACNFGWDWGAALVTNGPWLPMRLEGWSVARIASVRSHTASLTAEAARFVATVDIERSGAADAKPLTAAIELASPTGTVSRGEATIAGDASTAEIAVDVTEPHAWWPRSHSQQPDGLQPLYACEATLSDASIGEVAAHEQRVGLRTLELDTTPDDAGTPFVVKVNGEAIFCRGANWIPDDCLLDLAIDPARLRERLLQACAANMNMLRVWGGGLYETDAFYDLCDELGTMVYQDFPYACALYPEEEPHFSEMREDAIDNVNRLAHRASLVVWNGGNECLQPLKDWGWGLPGDLSWGHKVFFELLPSVVADLDRGRAYWPNCPYNGQWDIAESPNKPEHGTSHYWKSWFHENYNVYRRAVPRFASEFGFQAPPTWATLKQAIPEDQIFYDAPLMAHHQKSNRGDVNNRRHLVDHFNEPPDYADHHYLLQINQARALSLGVSWFRSRMPACMGTLYWQLNDCWPVVSWAALDRGMDGLSRPKPLYYATKRFYADRLLTLQPIEPMPEGETEPGPPAAYAVNDSPMAWRGELLVRRVNMDGQTLAEAKATLDVPARTNRRALDLPMEITSPTDPSREFIIATVDDAPPTSAQRDLWFFQPDKTLHFPSPAFDASLSTADGQQQLTLKANTLLRDLCVFVDRLEPSATVSDQMVTLLPGETVTLTIESPTPLDEAALTSPPVLRCVNPFGAG